MDYADKNTSLGREKKIKRRRRRREERSQREWMKKGKDFRIEVRVDVG